MLPSSTNLVAWWKIHGLAFAAQHTTTLCWRGLSLSQQQDMYLACFAESSAVFVCVSFHLLLSFLDISHVAEPTRSESSSIRSFSCVRLVIFRAHAIQVNNCLAYIHFRLSVDISSLWILPYVGQLLLTWSLRRRASSFVFPVLPIGYTYNEADNQIH